jgi:hypothetical protein
VLLAGLDVVVLLVVGAVVAGTVVVGTVVAIVTVVGFPTVVTAPAVDGGGVGDGCTASGGRVRPGGVATTTGSVVVDPLTAMVGAGVGSTKTGRSVVVVTNRSGERSVSSTP